MPDWATNGVALSATGVVPHAPMGIIVAPDGAGGAIVAWYDDQTGSGETDIFAQRVNMNGKTMWQANGMTLCSAGGAQSAPTIVGSSVGEAIVAWEDGRTGSEIYANCTCIAGGHVGVGDHWGTRSGTSLHRISPNPVASGVQVAFDIERDEQVTLAIHDVHGRCVRDLISNLLPAGRHEVRLDGVDSSQR